MKNMRLFVVVLLGVAFFAAGCAQPAATPEDAIKQAESQPTVEAKVDYLISQANAFINSQKFEEAVEVAKHVLAELDSNSEEAKGILQKAQEELKKLAQQKVDEVAGGVSNALGNLGQ